MARNKDLVLAIALPAAAIILLFIECRFFSYSTAVILDIAWLGLLILVPGIAILNFIRKFWSIALSTREVIVLGGAIAFWIPVLLLQLGLSRESLVQPLAIGFAVGAIVSLIATRKN